MLGTCGRNVLNCLCVILEKIITSGEVQVVLKFNVFTIFKETYDACELALKYGHTCPIVPGTVYVQYNITIMVP